MWLVADKKSYAMEIATKPLIMTSEISGLELLRAFTKREDQVAPVRFQRNFLGSRLRPRFRSPSRQPLNPKRFTFGVSPKESIEHRMHMSSN